MLLPVRNFLAIQPDLSRCLLLSILPLLIALLAYRRREKIARVNRCANAEARERLKQIVNIVGYAFLWITFIAWAFVLAKTIAHQDLLRAEYYRSRRNFLLAARSHERYLQKLLGRSEGAAAVLAQCFGETDEGVARMLTIDCFWLAEKYDKVLEYAFGDILEWMTVIRAYAKLQRYDEARLYMKAIMRRWNATRPMTESDQQYFHDWVERCIQRGGEPEPMSEADKQQALETLRKVVDFKAFEWLEETLQRK